ncbi:MAG: hypothetical protein LBR64_10005 [Dysgonamonadaceae bacterium]|jgi:hypothetical protein|nr:hypothetical protein [Dysgonamonadaceae bacterium]
MENFTEDETVLSIVSEIKSDAFAMLVKQMINSYIEYFEKTERKRSINYKYITLMREIAKGESSIKDLKRKYALQWNLTEERVRQIIYKVIRVSINRQYYVYLEEKNQNLEKENQILTHKMRLLNDYIKQKDIEIKEVKVEEKNFDSIDFKNISTRLGNILKANDFTHYQQILNLSLREMARYKGCGNVCMVELHRHLREKGYNVDWEL